jgi:hypothetical protein
MLAMSGGVSVYYCMGTWGPKYLGICLCYGDLGHGDTEIQGKGARGDPGKEEKKKRKTISIPTCPYLTTHTPTHTKKVCLFPDSPKNRPSYENSWGTRELMG